MLLMLINRLVHENGEMDDTRKQESHDSNSLRDFIAQIYQKQKDAGLMSNSDDVNDERTSQFFKRAMSESQRMSAEVSQSEHRQQELYRELGADNVHAWTMEHASAVTVTLQENGQRMEDMDH